MDNMRKAQKMNAMPGLHGTIDYESAGFERWSSQNRPKLVNIIKAKSSHRASDYVKALADHRPLKGAIIKYAKQIDM